MKSNSSRIVLVAVAALAFSATVAAASEKVLHTFTAGKDGASPFSGVISDGAGNLYGTTYLGGAFNDGLIFKLMPTASGPWKESIVYHFTGGKDGHNPVGLAIDSAGILYGIAINGGLPTRGPCKGNGCGTLFRLSPSKTGGWTFNLLHAFTGGPDGAAPEGITLDAAGDIFVTTFSGAFNDGAVFEMSPSPTGLKGSTVHMFPASNSGDGVHPVGPVTIDSAGNLFGITNLGGAHSEGAVYEISPSASGWTETVIYSFTGATDGQKPFGGLIFDATGNLLGTASHGGQNGFGVVFQLTPGSGGTWTESVLYSFTNGSDGGFPEAGLTLDSAGNLFGTTTFGGVTASSCTEGCGVVFKLTPSSSGWTESAFYSFTGGSDGNNPYQSGVTRDSSGNLFGTTLYGGKPNSACTIGCGVVFELPGAATAVK
jgi:uncharacterized repeat protein (TIGR03803 family)